MIKATIAARKAQFRDLAILINGEATIQDKEKEELGKMMGLGRTSAFKYLKTPEKLPLDKLLRLCKGLGIPLDKVRESIWY